MKQRFHSTDKYVFRGLYVCPCSKEPDILARKTKEKMREQTKILMDHIASWRIASSCTDWGEGRDKTYLE